MARTVDPQLHAARRDAILDVVERLVVEKGFDRLTIQDLIAGTGMSKGAFYHYFAAKSDVLEALLERRLARWEAALAPVARGPGGPRDRLRALLRELGGAKSRDRALLVEALRSLYSDDNALVHARTRRAAAARFAPLVEALVVEGVAAGELAVHDPVGAARVVLSLMQEGADQIGLALLGIADGATTAAELDRTALAYQRAIHTTLGAAPGSLDFIDPADLSAWAAAATGHGGRP
ncbi:TetR/AcrR family transcriptional regulator [Pseudonocardia humida]|uniref:TetR/AcrR family transcriptional regulator n=1 Tax=Pseudonocardia humida TaxID=2800819 RepID=A0ABT1A338_9PSEU|nr:TetR/AcrR family transcriptional regulator [Pseudonocardia humida]MCO1657214.1 TetR/AcrR family transcriptional regulator [Pseudonocardia humida]